MNSDRGHELFWCMTDDHEEDWFVLAEEITEATVSFAALGGYEPEEVRVKAVCPVPESLVQRLRHRTGAAVHPLQADTELLRALGAELLNIGFPRVVRFDGEIYVEGRPDLRRQQALDDALEAIGRGRPNGSPKHPHLAS